MSSDVISANSIPHEMACNENDNDGQELQETHSNQRVPSGMQGPPLQQQL